MKYQSVTALACATHTACASTCASRLLRHCKQVLDTWLVGVVHNGGLSHFATTLGAFAHQNMTVERPLTADFPCSCQAEAFFRAATCFHFRHSSKCK